MYYFTNHIGMPYCIAKHVVWWDFVAMAQILTANRLDFGDVVYWSAAHGWVGSLYAADLLEDETADALLTRAQEFVARREIVNPYLFDVRVVKGRVEPVKERETIRAMGPTVRPDLGKQAA